MATNGNRLKLMDLAEIVTGMTPPSADDGNWGDGPMFLTPTDIYRNDYFPKSSRALSLSSSKKHKSRVIDKPAIAVVCIGATIGKIARISTPTLTNQQINSIVPDPNLLDTDFIYYRMQLMVDYLRQLAGGSATPLLVKSVFEQIEIEVPPIKEQMAIGRFLSQIDQLINLNNVSITELENLSELIYKYWFLQFNFPRADGTLVSSQDIDLKFNEALQRDVPKDWQVVKLGDLCDIYQPVTISGKDLKKNGQYKVYGSNGIIGSYDKFNHVESEIVVSCRGDCGNVIRTLPNSWITGNAMVFKPNIDYLSNEYLFQSLKNLNLKNIVTGSVQGQITRGNVENLSILLPPRDLLEAYSGLVDSIVIYKQQLIYENETLQSQLDYLLPLLMFGGLEVSG